MSSLGQLLCNEDGVEKKGLQNKKSPQSTWNGEDQDLSEGTSSWNFRTWNQIFQNILTALRGKNICKTFKESKLKYLANVIICQAFVIAAEMAKVVAFVLCETQL